MLNFCWKYQNAGKSWPDIVVTMKHLYNQMKHKALNEIQYMNKIFHSFIILFSFVDPISYDWHVEMPIFGAFSLKSFTCHHGPSILEASELSL